MIIYSRKALNLLIVLFYLLYKKNKRYQNTHLKRFMHTCDFIQINSYTNMLSYKNSTALKIYKYYTFTTVPNPAMIIFIYSKK